MRFRRFYGSGGIALAFLVACGGSGDSYSPANPFHALKGETRAAVEARLGKPQRTRPPSSEEMLSGSECATGATVVATYERQSSQSKYSRESLLVFYDGDDIVLCTGIGMGLMHVRVPRLDPSAEKAAV